MLARIRSAYLRDERKYDRWGGLGKVLVTLEVLRAEGIVLDALTLENVVNAAFPRTFSSQRVPPSGEPLPPREELQLEIDVLVRLFREWGIGVERAEILAVEEIGERRRLDTAFLRDYLK